MDIGTGGGNAQDLSTLAWVHDELRRSLETAHKALRRHQKEADGASEVDAVDPALLRQARTLIHQGVGALELVGMADAATLLRAAEAAVVRCQGRPRLLDAAAVETIERGSFALLDLLGRRLAGRDVPALLLFPQYRALQQLAGAARAHPADLWPREFQWRELPSHAGDEAVDLGPRTLARAERDLLALMRGADAGAPRRLEALFAGLGASDVAAPSAQRMTQLWRLAAAFFEAQADGALKADVQAKRVASRLLSLLRAGERAEAPERLALDLLFFCAQAQPQPGRAPGARLADVRRVHGLADVAAVDYEAARLGRFDPAVLAQARKRVAGAKEVWSAVAGGELMRMPGLAEQFALVGDSVQRLYPQGDVLARSLQAAATQTVASGAEPAAGLAMEVATSLLYVDASLEDGDLDHVDLAERVRRLSARIDAARAGAEAEPLERWMEDLYRRVSDRQTMGSVVHELRASLSEVEKQIDQYFRDPAQRALLIPVPAQLSAMRGVLSVLGMDQASQAVLRMRDDVDALAGTEVDPQRAQQTGTFDRLADNLGALSFLIDMVSVQPAMAKSLFQFDPATGSLKAVMARAARHSGIGEVTATAAPAEPHEQLAQTIAAAAAQPDADAAALARDLQTLALQATAADQPELAEAATTARLNLDSAEGHAEIAIAREQVVEQLAVRAAPVESAPPQAPLPSGLEDDDEMRGVFLEEAHEVIATARESLATLEHDSASVAEITVVRRAFHTLKGSSRMVGLKDFGEAAWACEQLYNARLADGAAADADLRGLTGEVLDALERWVHAIEQGDVRGHTSQPLVAAADALRLNGTRVPVAVPPPADPAPEAEPEAEPDLPPFVLDLPEIEPSPQPASALPASDLRAMVPSLPDAQDLDFTLDFGTPPPPLAPPALELADVAPPSAEPSFPVAAPAEELSFELDLGSLDEQPRPSQERPALAEPSSIALEGIDAVADDLPLPVIEPVGGPEVEPEVETEVAPVSAPEDVEIIEVIETAEVMPLLDLEEPLSPGGVPEPLHSPQVAEVSEAPGIAEIAEVSEFDVAPDPAPAAEPSMIDLVEADDVEQVVDEALPADDEQYKVIGHLRIGIALFNIYLNEADELSRRLVSELGEWSHLLDRPVSDTAIALAHSLAGSSATVGYGELSQLARTLEHALMRSQNRGIADAGEAALFNEAAEQLRYLLHQFAAGFLKSPEGDLIQRLAEHDAPGLASTPSIPSIDVVPGGLVEPLDAAEPQATDEAVDIGFGAAPALAEPVLDVADAAPQAVLEAPAGAEAGEPDIDLGDDASDTRPAPLDLPREPQTWEATPAPDDTPPAGAAEAAAAAALAAAAAVAAAAVMPTALTDLGQPELRAFDAPASVPAAAASEDARDDDEDIDATDAPDVELFPIFEEEALELLPQLQSRMREWSGRPGDAAASAACMRTLHTLKGGARLAGAMRLGELAHRLETAVEHLAGQAEVRADQVEQLMLRVDAIEAQFERLRRGPAVEVVAAPAVAPAGAPAAVDRVDAMPLESPAADDRVAAPVVEPEQAEAPVEDSSTAPPAGVAEEPAAPRAPVRIDWSRFAAAAPVHFEPATPVSAAASGVVRVRAGLLDRVVNHAGEVSITRSRIESDVGQLKTSAADLSDNLERLRSQLRDIELQAETQIASRLEAAKQAAQFDPLEMDRFTRFQELTRMMAEAVNDVATVQRSLQRTLQSTEDELAAQARLTRDLQDDLLRTRMVEFDGLSERLYRVVRQAAKDAGRQVRLDIVGGSIEVDRGVLERMTGSFEHLLRNAVAHGIEPAEQRQAAGKDATGTITVALAHEGNEVAIEFRDDGAGLDLARIRQRGEALGLIAPGTDPGEAELAALIFHSGFSTAETVTGLAGRGVGMDVVRSEVNAMGGRIETATAAGRGTSFRMVLPLTTAVTQVVMLRCGELTVAVPSTLVEIVRRAPAAEIARAYAEGTYAYVDRTLPFFWLASLLQGSALGSASGRTAPVVVIRSAAQRIAVHVDEVVGNQEVVVKNLGPQLVRLPGLTGMTLLPSGLAALIYNPVALATLYGESARRATVAAMAQSAAEAPAADAAGHAAAAVASAMPEQPPLVLVVDDSLTVRRVTQRLLAREGYRVVTAKDGMEGLEKLGIERPAVLLTDIEMPRMDGFDLVRNLRVDPKLAGLPVIMITSRIAQKHRDYAAELGVDHYLGKPYGEEELIGLVARYARSALPAG